MNDIDDVQIKAEIDKIMKGVKNIMQKIEAATPKKEPEPEHTENPDGKPHGLDNNSAGST